MNHVLVAVFFALAALELVYFLDFSSDISSAASAFSVASLNTDRTQQNNAEPQQQLTTRLENGFQSISLKATPFGYDPNRIVAKAGVPLRISVEADASAGCGRAISLPDFGIQKILTPGQKETIELSGEQLKPGNYRYQCFMAMMRGTLVVI
jgi:heme/copper-type cytochrome/quinol oxidase subunit 2